MAKMKTVWGIDIGQCALKAVKLRTDGESPPEIEAYEVVEHAGVLSQPDADVNVLIQASLDEFLRRADLSGTSVSMSVFGQSIMRFVKLPPVEAKRIPDIVRFEAEQQIPFPLKEMVWRYQAFYEPDSPDIEAGLFAMKTIDVAAMLSYFVRAGIEVDLVQMAPLSLFNFMQTDGQCAKEGATVLADIGADKTHLVISDGDRVWTRTIQIGGNNFTESLVRNFKLNFEKAEQQKRNATNSKYARHIFQAMRPVFAELVQEIQRSLGYYSSLHREVKFAQLIGMGNGFLLPGMKKYLEQNLNMPVRQVKKFNKVLCNVEGIGGDLLGLGVAYGLAAQSLGLAPIMTNMLPHAVVKQRLWKKKTPWFVGAAVLLVVAAALFPLCAMSDIGKLKKTRGLIGQVETIAKRMESDNNEASEISTDHTATKEAIRRHLEMRANAWVVPTLDSLTSKAFTGATLTVSKELRTVQTFATLSPAAQADRARALKGHQARMEVISMLPFAVSKDGVMHPNPLRKELMDSLKSITREDRQILTIDEQGMEWIPDLTKVSLGGEAKKNTGPSLHRTPSGGSRSQGDRSAEATSAVPGYVISVTFRTPASRGKANTMTGEFVRKLREAIARHPYLAEYGQHYKASLNASDANRDEYGDYRSDDRGGEEVKNPDPMFPDESMDDDSRYVVRIAVALLGDGISQPRPLTKSTKQPG
ncbi:MAG: pilus assembly protein PilM [Phycisphaerales bacterium]|jgi:type IV pilus assembly protein PilM|nr:pilus assembly protein PilM [Phycisphaerales bacterium]MBT7171957.1 pilus assembly protein PilM [Phycisphaerales bacterium]